MKNVKRFLLTGLITAGIFQANAQTADEIIAKHLEAVGGKAKIASVTSVKIENTMQIMGNDAPSVTTVLVGKGFKTESEFQGQKIVQIVTDKGGWAVNPMGGSAEMAAIPDEQYKANKESIYFTPFLDYASRGSKVELLGKEKIGEKEAFKVKYTTSDNVAKTLYFDPTSYYLVRAVQQAEMMGQQVDIILTFSDFKKTDFGVVIPYSTEYDYGGQFQMSSKVKKAEINPAVDPAIFVAK